MSTGQTWALGEFSAPEPMLRAIRVLREAGFSNVDYHSPYPLHDGDDALGIHRSRVPFFALMGALAGAVLGYGMQWYLNAVDYPLNVGGRPPNSPPSFIPVSFELAVLLSAGSIFVGLLALMRLPRLYHAVFELEEFRSASTHAFWISVAVEKREVDGLRSRLSQLGAQTVSIVEEEP